VPFIYGNTAVKVSSFSTIASHMDSSAEEGTSSERDKANESFESMFYREHPICQEYHYRTGQFRFDYCNLRDIPEDGLKYKCIVDQLELTERLDRAIGKQCGHWHWKYTFVKVFQDGTWHTVLLTDGCIDRLIGHNAQQFEEATGEYKQKLRQAKIRRLTLIQESRLQLLVHQDRLHISPFVSALTILGDP
jgi:hypothetical protein